MSNDANEDIKTMDAPDPGTVGENRHDAAGGTDAATDPIRELARDQKKTLFFTRIIGISSLVTAATVVIACLIVIPRAISTIDQMNALMAEGSAALDNANATLANIDSMTAEIETAADGINELVDANPDVLAESMAKLNNIDFDSLNKAIKDLGDVVEPMATFFNRFR